MLASSIGWILIASGVITAAGGFAALLFPRPLLRVAFAIEPIDRAVLFFTRHWGLLIFLVGALTVYAAYDAATRNPILAAAAIEKVALVAMIFFGPLRRTIGMTAIAIVDGIFAILYITYLVGL